MAEYIDWGAMALHACIGMGAGDHAKQGTGGPLRHQTPERKRRMDGGRAKIRPRPIAPAKAQRKATPTHLTLKTFQDFGKGRDNLNNHDVVWDYNHYDSDH